MVFNKLIPLDFFRTSPGNVFHAITDYKTAFSRSRCINLKNAPERYFYVNTKLVKTHGGKQGNFNMDFKASEPKLRVK